VHGMCSESRNFIKFWEISDNISLTVQAPLARYYHLFPKITNKLLQWNTNRKSYVTYRMTPLPMPLNDLKGIFCCLKLF